MRIQFDGPKRRLAVCTCSVAALLNVIRPAYGQVIQDTTPFREDAEPLHYGPFDLLYSVRGSAMYDDNIFIRTNKTSDFIWTITPGVMAAVGDYRAREENLLTLQYTPSFIFFTDHTSQNAIDHEAFLNGQVRSGPLVISLKQGYQNLSGA